MVVLSNAMVLIEARILAWFAIPFSRGPHFVVWFSEDGLHIVEKRNKRQSKRKRYSQLNTKLQKIARRDKKAFLSEQCKEIQEQNGKDQRFFKKIGDIKGTFHAKMDIVKDGNGQDLTKEEEIKKMWQEYIELYKKGLNDMDNHGGVVTPRARHSGM